MSQMWTIFLFLFSLSAFSGQKSTNDSATFLEVHQTSFDQAFTTKYEFRLVDGLLWFRIRGSGALWQKFAGTGLAPLDFDGKPASLVRISVDGGILYAFTAKGRIFDAKINDGSVKTVEWSSKWGWPLRIGAVPIFLDMPFRDLAGSYLDGEYARTYEDRAGNSHLVKGIMTLYVLNKEGNAIHFNDAWLPPNHFEARFSTPNRGQVEALAIAAAGSMVMIIDANGDIYTRMIDFDTLGGNPGIAYTFENKNFGYSPTGFLAWCRDNLPWFDKRVLPTNEWELQPKIQLKPGAFVTTRLTMFQNGTGNLAREMRVEAVDEKGTHGFYRKSVDRSHTSWDFVALNEPLLGSKEENSKATKTAYSFPYSFNGPHDQTLAGKAIYFAEGASAVPGMTPGRVQKGEATLKGWNLVFDPILVEFEFRKGSARYSFNAFLHLIPGVFPFNTVGENTISGRLVLPEREQALKAVPPLFRARVVELLDDTFKRRTDLPVSVRTSANRVQIDVNTLRMPNQSAAVFKF